VIALIIGLPVLFLVVVLVCGLWATAGERAHRHTHYLKGSLRCGRCQSRIAYCVTRGNGGRYAYFFCLGRHERRTDCDLPHLQAEDVENAVVRAWEHESVEPKTADDLRRVLIDELASLDEGSEKKRKRLKTQEAQIEQERRVWAEKSFSGTVPDDIAAERQQALAKRLVRLREELGRLAVDAAEIRFEIERVLDLAKECGTSYRTSKSAVRRQWNQAWFQWIEIDVDKDQHSQVRTVIRTPLIEAMKTARIPSRGNDHFEAQPTHGHRRGSRLFSYVHGLRVGTLVELIATCSNPSRALARVLERDTTASDLDVSNCGRAETSSHPRRRTTTHLGPEQSEAVVVGYQAGRTIREMAAEFGTTRSTASEILKRKGVSLRLQSLSEKDVELAIELNQAGLSLVQVSERFKKSPRTIRRQLLRNGVQSGTLMG